VARSRKTAGFLCRIVVIRIVAYITGDEMMHSNHALSPHFCSMPESAPGTDEAVSSDMESDVDNEVEAGASYVCGGVATRQREPDRNRGADLDEVQ
jgi:hypothetical protein